MTTKTLVVALLIGMLAGCATRTSVHVYARYMNEQEQQRLQQSLEQNGFDVTLNTLGFPASIEASTLLYSLLLKNSQDIDHVTKIAGRLGITVAHVRSLTEGNHWYTKDSLALFVLPENFTGVLKVDLHHRFISDKCPQTLALTLHSNGTFDVHQTGPYHQNRDMPDSRHGTWYYRQPPYLELRAANGRDFSYYQIYKRSESDIVSAMQVIRLTPLQGIRQAPHCEMMYAERLLQPT
ncbi:hypothetical protein [Salinimonas lutimaris]|uniref:hypothetical protein n=1 Tax=Salinimonas lutimaris TaxID=914153 RepID=UPI0010BFC4AB|nr:hypothetical protein [Salinimonas lutimaris]